MAVQVHSKPSFLAVWSQLQDDSAQASNFPIAFNRFCFARSPEAPLNHYEETLRLQREGYDFVSENPAATYGIRLEALGMMASMDAKHRRFATNHLNDDKILDLLGDGFPILELMGTHDSLLDCGTLVESLKPIAKNLEVQIIEGASHALFIDAPDEVIEAIIKFAKKIHSSNL